MPEGDTIHNAAARIRAVLAGHVPDEILTPQQRHRNENWPQRLAGRELSAVEARGKHLLLRFAGGLTLHSHLRMTGAWSVRRRSAAARGVPRRAWLLLRRGEWEVVQLGGPVLELMTDTRVRSDPRLARLGPDVIGDGFDEELFLRRLREDDPTRAIGDALLDQRTVAGIGNMWKCEICFAAGVDPWRAIAAVGDEQALALVGFAREQMTVSARLGARARPHAVYRRAGRPCVRCGAPVRQRGQGDDNRVTYWCASCQR